MIFLNICLCKLALEFWKKWGRPQPELFTLAAFFGGMSVLFGLLQQELLLQFERKKSNKVYIF